MAEESFLRLGVMLLIVVGIMLLPHWLESNGT